MSEILIKAEGVSKKFAKDLKKSLLYGISDVAYSVLGKPLNGELRADEFWAVSDVNFEVRRGECLALIGHNGAGKSTLLKMLNGLINPDKGRIEMRGRVGALIELGAGFNPVLTGRENIYNSGAVLGFTKAEITKKLDEIIDFSELKEFIDMPVQNYSSGMRIRLGYSVASQMEPDILLLDEVLSVGDLGFQAKCYNKINELMDKCAIIFVSHSMPQVARIATEIIYLNKGAILYQGRNVAEGVDNYYKTFNSEVSQFVGKENSIEILDFSVTSDDLIVFDNGDIKQGAEVCLKIKYNVNKSLNITNHDLFINIYDQSLRSVMVIISPEIIKNKIANASNPIEFEVKFKCILSPGKYSFWLFFAGSESDIERSAFSYAVYQSYFTFNVSGASIFSTTPVHMPAIWSTVE